jgi:cytochrome P450
MNPPEHTRLRTLLSKAFGVKQAADLRRLTVRATERLLGRLLDQSHADLVTAFNYPLPIAVICALLNLGEADQAPLQRETQALVKVLEISPLTRPEIADANAAAQVFGEYFRALLRERRRRPGADLVSLLLQTEQGDDRLTEDEIVANITLLFLAGHETTANMIGNALVTLFRHPAERARLCADASLLPAAVDECLRYEPSVHIAARSALVDLSIDGVLVRRGDLLYINLGSANRDSEVFDDPDRFVLGRPDAATKHLAFGGGIHYCLGARLARMELETALTGLFRRLPQLRLEHPELLRWKPTLTIRGLESLPAVW